MLFLVAIVLGIVFGLLTGGRLGNLARIRFRWAWFVVAVVIVREAVLVTPLKHIEGAQYIYVLALVGIIVWTIWQRNRLMGIWLVGVGTTLNLIVILANGARMPVAPEFAGSLVKQGSIGQYTLMGGGTRLNLLGDWIQLYPFPEVYSPGDVLVALGLAIAVFIAVATPARIVS